MKALIKNMLRPLYHYARSRNERAYCHLVSAYSADERFTARTIEFLDYTMNVSDSVSVVHQFKEIFVDEAYRFRSEKQSPLVYDCGANVGMGILYFRHLYPESIIKAFEADPLIFSLLKKNVERNLSPEGIELVNKAVWINEGGVDFNQEGADGGSVVEGGATAGKAARIESVRLKDLLEKAPPDFLKMDIEGAELQVLQDCSGALSRVAQLFVEYHSRPDHIQELDRLLNLLTNAGFRYTIQSPIEFRAPFDKSYHLENFDLQLNIFCYRLKNVTS